MRAPIWPFILLTGCTPSPPSDDDTADDDTAQVDDDSAQGDDDTTPDLCTATADPFTLTITGAIQESHSFSLSACEDYNGDVWRISYDSPDGWIFRIITGPLVEGQPVDTGISVSLVSGNTYSFTGRTDQGLVASVTAERYDGTSPCGHWTTAALHSATLGDVELATQPFAFRCQ